MFLIGCGLLVPAATAQVIPDQSLPGENTQVDFLGNTYTITGGATRGSNLFHSFKGFSIPAGEAALFDHAPVVDIIFGRVTGGELSTIDGLLRTPTGSSADLFLMNPQGIVFGPDAELQVGGSFFATTADRITFADGTDFSAAEPQPVTFTISRPIGLAMGDNPGSIVNKSRTISPITFEPGGLAVSSSDTLALVGNGIELAGGILTAFSSNIEVASLGPGSTVGLVSPDSDGNTSWQLDYSSIEELEFRDIRLLGSASIGASNTSGDSPTGQIRLYGRDIGIDEESNIFNINLGQARAESVVVNASEQLTLSDRAQVFTWTITNGGGGNLIIRAGALALNEDALLRTFTESSGNGGNIRIDAPTGAVDIEGSRISSDSVTGATGDIGSLTITAESLDLKGQSSISTPTLGEGRGGDLSIRVDSLRLQDESEIFTTTSGSGDSGNLTLNVAEGDVEILGGSSLRTQSVGGATGSAGTLTLAARYLLLSDESAVSTSTSGGGEGGALNVNVPEGTVRLQGSELTSQANVSSSGAAGPLALRARHLRIEDGSDIATSTFGSGDAGRLDIDVPGGSVEVLSNSRIRAQSEKGATGAAGALTVDARDLSVRGGSGISTAGLGDRPGGELRINTTNGTEVIGAVEDIDTDGNLVERSSLITSVSTGAGPAGDIRIDTGTLQVQDGGRVQSGTRGTGDGGTTVISAESVEVIGESATGRQSWISAAADDDADAEISGAVEIDTDRLFVGGGGVIFTSTDGRTNGGAVTVQANDVVLSGRGIEGPSGLFARTEGSGDSGRLTVSTDTLRIENGARLSVSTDGDAVAESFGMVGDIFVDARIVTLDGGEISGEALSGDGGNLNLTIHELLLLSDNSLISTTAGTAEAGGDGGNITILAPGGFVVALPDGSNDIVANAFEGSGGNILISATGIYGFVAQRDRLSFNELRASATNDISASSQFGPQGTIAVSALVVDPSTALQELSASIIDPEALITNSCLSSKTPEQGRYVVVGSSGLTATLDDATTTPYPTGEVRTLPEASTTQGWQPGDPIVEPDQAIQLADGRIVFTHRCQRSLAN